MTEAVQEALDVIRKYGREYVPDGFRDDDGVWHQGPHRQAFFEAIGALVYELKKAER